MNQESIEIIRKVQKENLACAMKSGTLPVLATPQMIAWMEEAASLCLDLPEGQTSVGIRMNVSHDAPSALGADIRIQARLLSVKGRKIEYEVSAYDGTKCIGKGVHTRFVVDQEKFLARVYPEKIET